MCFQKKVHAMPVIGLSFKLLGLTSFSFFFLNNTAPTKIYPLPLHDPLPILFQALRIVVNQELEQLALALPAPRATLGPGGRMAVIPSHSGEDRIVKHAFRDWSRSCVCPPRQPVCTRPGRTPGPPRPRQPDPPGPAE